MLGVSSGVGAGLFNGMMQPNNAVNARRLASQAVLEFNNECRDAISIQGRHNDVMHLGYDAAVALLANAGVEYLLGIRRPGLVVAKLRAYEGRGILIPTGNEDTEIMAGNVRQLGCCFPFSQARLLNSLFWCRLTCRQ